MLTFVPMRKSEAIQLFGGLQKDVAAALGITPSAVSQWPDDLDQATEDRVIGAAVRLGKLPPQQSAANEGERAAG